MVRQVTQAKLASLTASGAKVKKAHAIEVPKAKPSNADAKRHAEIISVTRENSVALAELAQTVQQQAQASSLVVQDSIKAQSSLIKEIVVAIQGQTGGPVSYRCTPNRGRRDLIESIDIVPIINNEKQITEEPAKA